MKKTKKQNKIWYVNESLRYLIIVKQKHKWKTLNVKIAVNTHTEIIIYKHILYMCININKYIYIELL